MKALLVVTVLSCFCGVGSFAGDVNVHKFQLWGELNKADKQMFFMGFTNGLAACRVATQCTPARGGLLDCLFSGKVRDLGNIQAIAMIDKYYKENPERWNEPIGAAMIDALTVKGGPCGGTPKK